MSWNKQLTQLNDALGLLLPFREDVLPYLAQAGIKASNIRFDPKPVNLWFSILDYAERNGQINALVDVLHAAFPTNSYLISYRDNAIYDLGVDIKDITWHGSMPKEQLEKILGKTSTLLPIHFLTDGIAAAQCVVRIVLPVAGGSRLGTGFLIDANLLVTNNHVLANVKEAADASIQFNYEEISPGHPKSITTFKLDPATFFLTSVADDWTIVKIVGEANARFGALKLRNSALSQGDYVNIIQHPGGGYKQIGLYRNVITYSDDRTVQYLTDTEPGSSGSPVFNSNWEVVALHNSSGTAKETIKDGNYLRNQGINIAMVMNALKTNGM